MWKRALLVLALSLAACGDGSRRACRFEIDASISSRIATVGVVTWSLKLEEVEVVDEAYIEFGPVDGGPVWQAPVDLQQQGHRTLLLGMKAERTYAFRIVARSGDLSCTSHEQSLTTGSLPTQLPEITATVDHPDQVTPGFIVTSQGIQGGYGLGIDGSLAMILDVDGDVVWYADAPFGTSRARMSWEADSLWVSATNVDGDHGDVRRVSMDGLDVETISELSAAHHDFTVLPGGRVVTIAHGASCDTVLERASDGTITPIVEDVSSLYQPVDICHANSILYHPDDDTFTLGDRNPNAFVKFTHDGELLWQLGGQNPLGDYFAADWVVSHGHQILDDGHFLLFNNDLRGDDGRQKPAKVLEYELDETTWTATRVWEYQAVETSGTLGDVQRLPGGNTLVTVSNDGALLEVDPEGVIVRRIDSESFGFADFRTSLYGEPLK